MKKKDADMEMWKKMMEGQRQDMEMWKKMMEGQRQVLKPSYAMDIPHMEKIKSIKIRQGLFGYKFEFEYYNKIKREDKTK